MSADISYLDAARQARSGPSAQATTAAAQYVSLAEEALALLPAAPDDERRSAICWISEAWLSLAEAELKAGRPSRRG